MYDTGTMEKRPNKMCSWQQENQFVFVYFASIKIETQRRSDIWSDHHFTLVLFFLWEIHPVQDETTIIWDLTSQQYHQRASPKLFLFPFVMHSKTTQSRLHVFWTFFHSGLAVSGESKFLNLIKSIEVGLNKVWIGPRLWIVCKITAQL